MKKLVVFNVGGALCCYLEVDNQSFLIDAGCGNGFNPAIDFLLPYFTLSSKKRSEDNGKLKFLLDQLIISHPHKDHISDIIDLDEYFTPIYLTCLNDKNGVNYDRIDWDLFFPEGIDESDECLKKLRSMCEKRNPLFQYGLDKANGIQRIYCLSPIEASTDGAIIRESYANNISLVTLFEINGIRILFPGDIMKEGVKKILMRTDIAKNDVSLRKRLRMEGVDILIAPHHGLESAFSVDLFNNIKNNKIRNLIIVSEKSNNPKDNRNVDDRYSLRRYCSGENNLQTMNGYTNNCMRRTSSGHICVDLEAYGAPMIKIIKNTGELLKWFLGK